MPGTTSSSTKPVSLGVIALVVVSKVLSLLLVAGLMMAIVSRDLGEIAHFVANGGDVMQWIIKLAYLQVAVGIALAVVHLRMQPVPFAAFMVVPLAIAVLGMQGMAWGFADVSKALADAPAKYAPMAMARGISIAEVPEVFGLTVAAGLLLPVMVVSLVSIRRARQNPDDSALARVAASAGLTGGVTPLLFGLGASVAAWRLAWANVFEASADGQSIQPALELLGSAQMRVWLALAVGVVVWGLMLWRALPSIRSSFAPKSLTGLGLVLASVVALVVLHDRGHRALAPAVGPFGYPPELAGLLADDELTALAQTAPPIPEGPLIRGFAAHAKESNATSLVVTPDGGVVLLGVLDEAGQVNAFVEAIDVYGESRWEDTWPYDEDDQVWQGEIALTREGKIVAWIWRRSGWQELRVYDLDGKPLLKRPWIVEASEDPPSFALGADDNVHLLWKVQPTDAELLADPETKPHFELRSHALDGKQLRTVELDGGSSLFAVDAAGEIVIANQSMVTAEGERAIKTLPEGAVPFSIEPSLRRYAADGSLRWDKTWGNGSCSVTDLVVAADGTTHVVGRVSGPIEAAAPTEDNDDVYVASVSASGESIELRQFGSADKDEPSMIAMHGDKLLIAGNRWVEYEGWLFVVLRTLGGEEVARFEWSEPKLAALRTAAIGADGLVYMAGKAEGNVEGFTDHGGDGWGFLLKWQAP